MPTIVAGYHKIPTDGGYIQVADYRNDEGLRIRENGDSPTLSARRHSEKDISTMPPLIIDPKIVSYTRDAKGEVTNRNLKEEANTIHSSVGGGGNTDQFVQPSAARIRRLTPIECERLQGFPDNHTEYGDYDGEVVKVSNTQRYKQCGNAVTVDVVQAIAEKCKTLFK